MRFGNAIIYLKKQTILIVKVSNNCIWPNALIRRSYWKHMEESITGVDDDSQNNSNKKFWCHIKGTKKDKVGTAPLKGNGILVSDSKGKAEILNRQYQSVFTREDSTNIPHPIEPPSPKMNDIVISRHGILKLLQDFKENKASDPDLIPPRVLKAAANPISFCLEFFPSLHFDRNFPETEKQANNTPVFKKGKRFKASNYHPILLTYICSKLLEHIVVSKIMSHFQGNNTLGDCQHGFRSKRSCET